MVWTLVRHHMRRSWSVYATTAVLVPLWLSVRSDAGEAFAMAGSMSCAWLGGGLGFPSRGVEHGSRG